MPAHVWPGQPLGRISARTANSERQRIANSVQLGLQTSGPARNNLPFVWNRSTDVVPIGGVLGIDRSQSLVNYTLGDTDDAWRSWPGVVGIAPTYTVSDGHNHLVEWVIALEELQPDEIGRCVITGAAWVYVDIKHEDHQHVRPIAGEVTKLVSSPTGMGRIIQRQPPAAGSTRLCRVELTPGALHVFDGFCSTRVPAAAYSAGTLTVSTAGRVSLRERRTVNGQDVWHNTGIVLPITHYSTGLEIETNTYCEVRSHGHEWRAYPDCASSSINLNNTITLE